MKGEISWSHHPYLPFDQSNEAYCPHICRIAPEENCIHLEWIDCPSNAVYTVYYRLMESNLDWSSINTSEKTCDILQLSKNTDYEFYVERSDVQKTCSRIRYARTGHAPGKVVNYLHPKDNSFSFSGHALCSPSLVKLPGGALLSSMDVYKGNAPQNLTLIFRSDDNGDNWKYLCSLFPCYWGTLFIHRNRLYMLATSTEYGDVLISESTDKGKSWKKPTVLFYGSSSANAPGWQHTPTPIIEHKGKLVTSIDFGAWSAGGHGICLLCCNQDSDLINPENWTVSPPTYYDEQWENAPKGKSKGLLEGSIVISPDGELVDILRTQISDCTPSYGIATLLKGNIDAPEEPLKFSRFIQMPSGSNCKTHVLFDEETKAYIAIGNICVDPSTPTQRNVLALEYSYDLITWKIASILLDYRHENPAQTGFQYIYFLIDGDDILYLSRTSINNAINYHDANYQTFHMVRHFRQYIQ